MCCFWFGECVKYCSVFAFIISGTKNNFSSLHNVPTFKLTAHQKLIGTKIHLYLSQKYVFFNLLILILYVMSTETGVHLYYVEFVDNDEDREKPAHCSVLLAISLEDVHVECR
jgi:hypothetical protein